MGTCVLERLATVTLQWFCLCHCHISFILYIYIVFQFCVIIMVCLSHFTLTNCSNNAFY